MNACKLPFDGHLALPGGVSALLNHQTSVLPFIARFADPDGFTDGISNRSYPAGRRKKLVKRLTYQHQGAHTKQLDNIKQLENEHCFTVCTGHQLNLFTGPAYFVYKIVHTIKLAQQLNDRYPDYHIVPVYWMASEDHDFAEINHLHTRQGKLEWDRPSGGAVGRMQTDGLQSIAEALLQAIDPMQTLRYRELIEESARCSTLAASIRHLVHGLFGAYGLVVIDADDPELKQLFKPVIEAELFHPKSASLIEKQSAKLESNGFNAQVNPRHINLFYLNGESRDRLELEGEGYRAGSHFYTETQLRELLQLHPKNFSPNVVLRPLYQEYILPNLAYVGGAGEISYWLQLKSLFQHYNTPFPALILRNSAVVFSKREKDLLDELQLSFGDLFEDEHQLAKRLVLDGDDEDTFFTESKAQLKPVYEALAEHLRQIDPTLEKRVMATWARHEKDIDGLEKSGIKARKQQHEVKLNRLRKLREVVHPKGVFQERYMNFFQLEVNGEGNVIEVLLERFDGFNPGIHVISPSA